MLGRAAQTHGLHAREIDPALRQLERDFYAQAVTDLGGDAELTERQRALLQYRAIVHRRVVQLHAALDEHGAFDRHGKLRVVWLQRLESLIATAVRLDHLLGLDRQTKDANTISPVEWLRQQQAHTEGE